MNIVLSKTAGFCFGVNRAVNSVYESLKKYDLPIYTYGPIIHNKEVVSDLEQKGVKIIEDIDQLFNIKEGIVIIRSHGVTPEVYEILKKNNILSIDMTCPYVKKIHKIVREYFEKGYQIIIVGDSSHPEVIGINGWCNNSAYIVNTIEDCYNLEKINKACIVAQTTFPKEKWEKIKDFLILNKCDEYVEFNTICNATNERQEEAAKISKTVDAMVIIGGKHSSNTQKLYNICKQYCKNCYHIETVKDLNLEDMKKFNNIGITAGASTPSWIINEVIDSLEKLDKSKNKDNLDIEEMNDYADLIEKSLQPVNVGDMVKGEVVAINNEEIIIDFGYKSDGIIPISDLKTNDSVDISNIVKVGDIIEAIVVKNDGEGNIILSKSEVDFQKSLEKVKQAYESKSIILVKIIGEVKGGVVGLFENLRVFIPMSQLSDKYVSDVSEYLSTTVPVKIIEFDELKNNIIASAKVVIEESKEAAKKNFWDGLHVGKEFIGKVKNFTDYGAFVDIGGTEGLLHISEVSHSKSDKTDKYFNINDEVEVYVKEFDREKEKVLLGLKNRPESPWTNIENKLKVGDIIECTIVRLVSYGAFVEIEPGIVGLVHISEISDKKLNKPDEVLEVGQKVKAKIISLDKTNRKIGLSIKEIAPINNKGESNLEIDTSQKNYTEDFNVTIWDAIKFKKLK